MAAPGPACGAHLRSTPRQAHSTSSRATGTPARVQNSDFGSTPTLFTATINGNLTSLLGVANKNGIYYALKRDALGSGPVWEDTIANGGQCPECGDGSISPSAWDGTTLYAA